MSKVCWQCKIDQPLTNFSKDKSHKDGLHSRCKECRRLYEIEIRKSDRWKTLHRKTQSNFIAKHPERHEIYRKAQKVPLKSACQRCNRNDVRLVRHHPDYSRPQEVITLCDKCHRAIHKEILNAQS